MVTALKILQLRNNTGAGMMDCKKALVETNGDIDVAKEYLRLLSQPLSRKKNVDGVMVRWQNEDYLEEAYNVVERIMFCPHGYDWDECPDCNH